MKSIDKGPINCDKLKLKIGTDLKIKYHDLDVKFRKRTRLEKESLIPHNPLSAQFRQNLRNSFWQKVRSG